jgi:hypothetical protein
VSPDLIRRELRRVYVHVRVAGANLVDEVLERVVPSVATRSSFVITP